MFDDTSRCCDERGGGGWRRGALGGVGKGERRDKRKVEGRERGRERGRGLRVVDVVTVVMTVVI